MNLEALKKTIRQELPVLLRLDPDFRSYILEITRGEYAGRDETQDWFHKILDEMRVDREKQGTKWDEQNRKWDEQNRLWREQWEAHQHQHKEEFNKLHEEIMALAKKHDRPDQIELDVIIKNGLLLICELKSSIDKAGMHIFERKARFYESRHNRKADRLIVISPMIDPKAQKLADRLNIETYSDSEEIENMGNG